MLNVASSLRYIILRENSCFIKKLFRRTTNNVTSLAVVVFFWSRSVCGMYRDGGTKGRNIQGGKCRPLGMEYKGREIQELRDGDESTIPTKRSSDHDLIIRHCHDRKFSTLEVMLLDDRIKT
jgi:hypothetical protein